MNWQNILTIIVIALLIWWLFRYVRQNPSAFSAENLNQGFRTMGILALILILFVSFLVFLVRH